MTRVEIELEPQEAKRSRRRDRTGPTAPVVVDTRPTALPADDAEPAPPDFTRNQLVVTALAVGLLALCVGWVLGRASAGDGDEGAASAAATSVPVTTARPTTSDTLPAAWTESAVAIDPRLAGQADRLVGVTQDGDVVDLGLDGTLRILTWTQVGGEVAQAPPIASDDWILLRSPTGARLLQGASPDPVAIPIDEGLTVLWQYGTDRFWTWSGFGAGDRELVEVDIGGERTGRVLSVDALFPFTTDPAGGVVAGDVGGFFTLDDAGSALLPGLPVAMGAGHLVVYACGETVDSCGLRLVDRETSQWRPVPGAPGSGRYAGWLGSSTGSPGVTGDGGAAMFPVSEDDGSSLTLLDFTTGEEHRFDYLDRGIGARPSGVWSADERFAYVLGDGVLIAFDRTTGESFPVVVPGADLTESTALGRLVSVTRRVPT